MEPVPENLESSRHQRCNEWAKLIRKLRWIGLEDEAQSLQRAIRSLPQEERDAVSIGPFSTD